MKKLIYILLIIISVLFFASLIYITIKADELSSFVKTVGFIVFGYLSIILFSYSWIKISK